MEQGIKREPIGNGKYIYVSAHHTFGTDAVLLADFCKVKQNARFVDLGTGCGIIAFLIKRDFENTEGFGVDISKEAISLADMSVENQFSDISFINSDLKQLKGKLDFGSFDLVVCNPPYKASGAGLLNADSITEAARHETACTVEDIIKVSAKLLKTSGKLCLCQRPERLAEILSLMRENKIEPKRLRLVCQREGEKPWLFLAEGSRCGNTGLVIEPPLYIEQSGALSDEMKKIYGPYKQGH